MPPKKARKRQGGHGDKHGPVRKTRKTDAGSSPIDNAPSTNRPKNRSCICGDSTCFTLLHIVLDYFLALPHVVFDGKKYPTGDLQWIKNKSSPGLCRFKSKSAHIKQSYLDQFHSLNFPKANLEGKAPYMCLLHFEWNMEHRVKTDILSLDELTKLTEISPALVAKNHGPTTANCKGAFVVVPSRGIPGILKTLARFQLHGMKQKSMIELRRLASLHCPDDDAVSRAFPPICDTVERVLITPPIDTPFRSQESFQQQLFNINQAAAQASGNQGRSSDGTNLAAQALHINIIGLVEEFLLHGDASEKSAAVKFCFSYLAGDKTAVTNSVPSNSHTVYETLREYDATKFWSYHTEFEGDQYYRVNQTRQLQRISPPDKIDIVFEVLGRVLEDLKDDFESLVVNADVRDGISRINGGRYLVHIPTAADDDSDGFRAFRLVVNKVQAHEACRGYTALDISNKIVGYCKAQSIPTLLHRMNPATRSSLKYLQFHRFSFLVSYGKCSAQCPHIDTHAPHAQGSVMLTSSDDHNNSTVTVEYRMKKGARIGNFNELCKYGNRLWSNLSEPLRNKLATDDDFQNYLAKYGNVLAREDYCEPVKEPIPTSKVGTTNLLDGGRVHAGPMSNKYRALIFFEIDVFLVDQEPMPSSADTQYNKVTLTVTEIILILTDIITDSDRNISRDDKKILLQLVAQAVQELDSPYSCDLLPNDTMFKQFATKVNEIVWDAKGVKKTKNQDPKKYITKVDALIDEYLSKKSIKQWK